MKPVILGVGEGNYFMLSADVLSGKFTPFAENRLVFMSETRQHNRGNKSSHDVMNDLKPYLADKPEWVSAERKGIDAYPVRNLTAWIFFSNEKRPLYIADGDRRLWILDNMGVKRKDPAYYESINKWLDKYAHLVASFLMDYPLTAADIQFFKGPAPDTAAKSALIAANRDPIEAALEEIIDEARQGGTFKSLIVTPSDVIAELKQRVPSAPSAQIVATHLRNLGAFPVVKAGHGAGVVSISSTDKKRLWILAPTDAAGRDYTKLTPAEAAQIYLGAKWPTPTYSTQTGVPLTAIDGGDEI
jgi:hypothetical protein